MFFLLWGTGSRVSYSLPPKTGNEEYFKTNYDFDVTVDRIEWVGSCCHKDELRTGSDDFYFTHLFNFDTKTLHPIVRTDARAKLEMVARNSISLSNGQYKFLVNLAKNDIKTFLTQRARNMHRANSFTIKKFPFEYFALLAFENDIKTMSRVNHLYKIHINNLKNEVFGKDCWKAPFRNATIEIIGPVVIAFSLKKPNCIRVCFKGCKMTGLDGQVSWNSVQPNSFQEPEPNDSEEDFSKPGLFDDPLNF